MSEINKEKSYKKFSVNVNRDQFLEALDLPQALQKIHFVRFSDDCNGKTEFTFYFEDMLEVLQQFQSMQRELKHTKETEVQLLTRSGGTSMI